MRFIGGKSLLLDKIYDVIKENVVDDIAVVGDLFCGSGIVSLTLKSYGYTVVSNDIMYMSYVLARGMTELNDSPKFVGLNNINVFEYLNTLSVPIDEQRAFIYHNYSPNEHCDRMYFQPRNARKIDAIRQQIENWYQTHMITEKEYYYLLACLISAVPYVANITGVYAAYLKHWDKRTYNELTLVPLDIVNGHSRCEAYNMDAVELCKIKEFDLVYIDTPYNQREYIPNYHILETIAKYDAPIIKGITGMRPYEKSAFCSKMTVISAFKNLFSNLKAKYAVVSYNNEGLISTEDMLALFRKFGEVKLYEYPYRRYKSKIPNNEKGLMEQIYFIHLGGKK